MILGFGPLHCLGFFVSFFFLSYASLLPAEPLGGVASGDGPTSAAPLVWARGQEKSSARPGGATIAAPRLSTRVASGSASRSAGWLVPPKRSPPSAPPIAPRGTTGPMAGRPTAAPFAGDCSSGPGNATGRTWLANTRRKSR